MKTETRELVVKPPHLEVISLSLRGTAPLVVHRFSKKATLMAKMAQGDVARSKKERKARDYAQEVNDARHIDVSGKWDGVHAGAFRQAMISACRLINFKMTLAKLCVSVLADGHDAEGTPLIRIYGKHQEHTACVRNDTGVADVRARPMYPEWTMKLRVRYDADQFSSADIVNLMSRVGMQVGIGEGRPDSKDSAGCGWGTFELVHGENVKVSS